MLSKNDILNSLDNLDYSILKLEYGTHKKKIENYNRQDLKRITKMIFNTEIDDIKKRHDSNYAAHRLKEKYLMKQVLF